MGLDRSRASVSRSCLSYRRYHRLAILLFALISSLAVYTAIGKPHAQFSAKHAVDWSATRLGLENLVSESLDTGDTSPEEEASTLSAFLGRSAADHLASGPDFCVDAPTSADIMVSIKTGASELATKIPTQLHTLAKCVTDGQLLVFSDYQDFYAGHEILDALQNVGEHWKESHPDFEHYKLIQQYRNQRVDLAALRGTNSWNLDKWKFLPQAFETWQRAPDHAQWFVFIEADTSLLWNNLLIWLRTLDPSKEIYLGSPTGCCGRPGFAHGGSGYIMSRAALSKLARRRMEEGIATYDSRWESHVSTSAFGDEVMTEAMTEANVSFSSGDPKLQAFQLFDMPFNEHRLGRMIVTLHHVSAIDVNDFWQFQAEFVAKHGWEVPILLRHIYEEFVAGFITTKRRHWKNRSATLKLISEEAAPEGEEEQAELDEQQKLSEIERAATLSDGDCAGFCRRRETCLQWMWKTGRCYVDDLLWFGERDGAGDGQGGEAGDEDVETWTSGWLYKRVYRMVDGIGDHENGTHVETDLVM